MTFGELVNGLGAKLGVEVEDAGGAVAFEIDGELVVVQQTNDDLVLARADLGEIPPDRRDAFASAALGANFLYKGTAARRSPSTRQTPISTSRNTTGSNGSTSTRRSTCSRALRKRPPSGSGLPRKSPPLRKPPPPPETSRRRISRWEV